MTCVNLVGRLTGKPELRATAGGTDYTYGQIAVKRETKQEPDTDFIPIKAFGQTAKYLAEYADKGMRIELTGKIRVNESTNGDRRKYTEVVIDRVSILDRKDEPKPAKAPDPYAEYDDIFS